MGMIEEGDRGARRGEKRERESSTEGGERGENKMQK